MPDITNVAAFELAAILPPGEPDLAPDDLAPAVGRRIAYFDAELARLADVATVYDAWRDRLDLVPMPPRQETLQELVEAARLAVRRRRLTLDREALDRRAGILAAIRTEVAR